MEQLNDNYGIRPKMADAERYEYLCKRYFYRESTNEELEAFFELIDNHEFEVAMIKFLCKERKMDDYEKVVEDYYKTDKLTQTDVYKQKVLHDKRNEYLCRRYHYYQSTKEELMAFLDLVEMEDEFKGAMISFMMKENMKVDVEKFMSKDLYR